MKKIATVVLLLCASLSVVAQKQEKVKILGHHGLLDAVITIPRLADGERVPMVIMCHGFNANKMYPGLAMAERLQAAGIASIAFDFNGHGDSEGRFQDMTVQNEVDDACCIYKYVRALPYISQVGVAGHSQGGVVAGLLAAQLGESKIACVAQLAPAAVLREDALRGTIFGRQYNALDPPEAVEVFGDIKLGRTFVLEAQRLPLFQHAASYTGAACLVHGTGDVVAPYSFSEYYHQAYRNSVIHLLDGRDHGFTGSFDEVTDLVVGFFRRHLVDPFAANKLVMTLRVSLGAACQVGNVPGGYRQFIPITGGTFEGPSIKGEVIAGGADYQMTDSLGRTRLEAIYNIRTDDGQYIHVRNYGYVDATDGNQFFLCHPHFEVPVDSKYSWLNTTEFVCRPSEEQMPGGIVLQVWRVE